jgi:hypothetical protein
MHTSGAAAMPERLLVFKPSTALAALPDAVYGNGAAVKSASAAPAGAGAAAASADSSSASTLSLPGDAEMWEQRRRQLKGWNDFSDGVAGWPRVECDETPLTRPSAAAAGAPAPAFKPEWGAFIQVRKQAEREYIASKRAKRMRQRALLLAALRGGAGRGGSGSDDEGGEGAASDEDSDFLPDGSDDGDADDVDADADTDMDGGATRSSRDDGDDDAGAGDDGGRPCPSALAKRKRGDDGAPRAASVSSGDDTSGEVDHSAAAPLPPTIVPDRRVKVGSGGGQPQLERVAITGQRRKTAGFDVTALVATATGLSAGAWGAAGTWDDADAAPDARAAKKGTSSAAIVGAPEPPAVADAVEAARKAAAKAARAIGYKRKPDFGVHVPAEQYEGNFMAERDWDASLDQGRLKKVKVKADGDGHGDAYDGDDAAAPKANAFQAVLEDRRAAQSALPSGQGYRKGDGDGTRGHHDGGRGGQGFHQRGGRGGGYRGGGHGGRGRGGFRGGGHGSRGRGGGFRGGGHGGRGRGGFRGSSRGGFRGRR